MASPRRVNPLPDWEFSPVLTDRYNVQTTFEFERIREVLILHYWSAERRDSSFWRYCRRMIIIEPLAETVRPFRDSGRFFRNAEDMFALTSWCR